MPTLTWEQEPTSRWLQFRFDQLGRSFFLKQPEIINQLCVLTDRDVVVHLHQQPYTASFWGNLMPLPQRPGIRRKADNPPASLSLAGDVCTIEHQTGGRWLGPEGWQTYPHYIRLTPADAPARTIVAQTCRKCGHRNRATARYCTQCGHNEFDPIYGE
jgi:ribosomal protein L40E